MIWAIYQEPFASWGLEMQFLPRAYLIQAEVSTSELLSMSKKILAEFFPDYKGPLPIFKVVNQKTAKWNGRCVFKGKNCVIELQKYIMDDPKTLDRILCHELIHHVDYLANDLSERKKHYGRDEGHGQFFKDSAKRINAKRGANYVTVISDQDFVISDSDKEFHMLIKPYEGNELCYTVAFKLNDSQKARIARDIQEFKARIVTSRDSRWMKAPSIGSGKVSIPTGDEQKAVRDLYENALPELQKKFEKLDSGKAYAVLIRKWKENEFGYSISTKLNTEQKKVVEMLKDREDARLIMTTDPKWSAGTKIKPYGGMTVPQDAERQKLLKELYEGAK